MAKMKKPSNINAVLVRLIIAILFMQSLYLTIAAEQAKKIKSEPVPMQITKNTFSDHLSEPKVGTFVMYYAPWCGHCKRMQSTWNQLAERHNLNGNFRIAKVDCTIESELCSDQDILSYPTFIYYKRNKINGERYEGERKLDQMESYMLTMNYLVNEDDDHDRTRFEDEKENEKDSHVSFTVHNLNADNFHEFVSSGFHFIKFFAPWCGHCQILAPTWEQLGAKYLNTQVKISKVDCTMHQSLCKEFNVRGYPTLLLFHNGNKVEAYNSDRTVDKFSKFIDSMVEKLKVNDDENDKESEEVETSTESIEINEPNEQLVERPGKIIELTGKTMDQALKKGGLLFVKFYAPWCGHCKDLAPAWAELAKHYEHNGNVHIGQVDCTNNHELCMNNNIDGFPTLVLFIEGRMKKQYDQARGLKDLIRFVESSMHDEL